MSGIAFFAYSIDGKTYLEFVVENKNICYTVTDKKECDYMLATKSQVTAETPDSAKLELYRLIGEGYKAMQEGRINTIEEVREKLERRRNECGWSGIY